MVKKLIAFTDLETTGLDSWKFIDGTVVFPYHEICEVGLVLAVEDDLRIIDTLDVKVFVEHPERFSKRALEVNGYNEADWVGAVTLETTLRRFNAMVEGARFASWNTTFDWDFLKVGFASVNIVPRISGYHSIDLWTAAYKELSRRGCALKSSGLVEVARTLSVPEEPVPHRAINGARLAYDIYSRL